MLKRYFFPLITAVSCLIFYASLEAQTQADRPRTGPYVTPLSAREEVERDNRSYQQKMDVMREDQTDSTDIFAIPLDDSEVEDQEELDMWEGKSFNPGVDRY